MQLHCCTDSLAREADRIADQRKQARAAGTGAVAFTGGGALPGAAPPGGLQVGGMQMGLGGLREGSLGGV